MVNNKGVGKGYCRMSVWVTFGGGEGMIEKDDHIQAVNGWEDAGWNGFERK